MKGRDLVSIDDLSKVEIEHILHLAQQLEKKSEPNLLKGTILATCFFEPSTRTRLSFESAMHRLGGACIGFSENMSTSVKKGESLSDTMKIIGCYSDLIVIRHPQEGAAKIAADATDKPVINAGDGANQHPTQALIDLFTIKQRFGKIDGLHIAIAGDLKYSRAVHSLSMALAHYAVTIHFVSAASLALPESIEQLLQQKGLKIYHHASLPEVMPKIDILYITRLQKERFSEQEQHKPLVLEKQHLAHAKPQLRILHPLPRTDELDPAIDSTSHAYYFQQAANGVPVRMALLALISGRL